MEIGIAYNLKKDFSAQSNGPEDRFEEYDSDATVDAIAGALEAAGHRAVKLGGGRALCEKVLAHAPDLVFNIAEGVGTRSREAHVPSVLEMLGIPYTHSDPLTLAVTLDKSIAKRLIASHGLPTPGFVVLDSPEQAPLVARAKLAYPVIAKPLFEGSSMGIRRSSRISSEPALREHLERLLADYRQPVMVEEFCAGAEVTVGVLGNGTEARVLGMMEIAPRQGRADEFVYSLEVKRNYLEEVEYTVPPKRPPALLAEMEKVALGCYRALECRDVARVDLRLDAAGQPKFIEVNPLPGVHPVTSDLVIMTGKTGLPYEMLINGIVDAARRRYQI
jgi:D-alanine-D-alanine ligase